ncbi:MAG: hypothetical protein K2X43_08960 [Hyphomonadaceae bacterium]|jgi:uncharacterized ferredoxin-like protein|nr:hypothetical protein [Hyphomonadaceae bacterium]
MSSSQTTAIDYKTHILIGVRANGAMSVICHWHGVPRQSEVEAKAAATREPFTTFILCTPTSIMRDNVE